MLAFMAKDEAKIIGAIKPKGHPNYGLIVYPDANAIDF